MRARVRGEAIAGTGKAPSLIVGLEARVRRPVQRGGHSMRVTRCVTSCSSRINIINMITKALLYRDTFIHVTSFGTYT